MRAVRYYQLPTTPKPTVIVVDDDLYIRRALQMQLQLAGFNVLVFKSGESLLGSDFPINNACLLLDIYMLGMSGVEALPESRSGRTTTADSPDERP